MRNLKFYIATTFSNAKQANEVSAALEALGHRRAFDWTVYRPGLQAGSALRGAEVVSLASVARQEIQAITESDVLVVLAPGRFGTHVEIGAALAARRPVILVGRLGADWNPENPFYWDPSITRVEVSPADLDIEKALEPLMRFAVTGDTEAIAQALVSR